MFIRTLKVVNFRCFTERLFHFDSRFVIIQGKNGTGKSSLLEALHYSCYLRSFRTHLNQELVLLEKNHFFVHVEVEQEQLGVCDNIQVGFSEEAGKMVKYNEKAIQSYKELISHYRVVTLAADDLMLVHSVPEERRNFLNLALCLTDSSMISLLKRYRQILDHRNSLLRSMHGQRNEQKLEELNVWSRSLWETSQAIKNIRVAYLEKLEKMVNDLIKNYFQASDADLCIQFLYKEKGGAGESFDHFWATFFQNGFNSEITFGRSFFGIHLDDFLIIFQNKKARIYASRGQQKLIVFLIKVAQLQSLTPGENQSSNSGVFLLDDFLTDFDDQRLGECFDVLQHLPYQIILTCPTDKQCEALTLQNPAIISL